MRNITLTGDDETRRRRLKGEEQRLRETIRAFRASDRVSREDAHGREVAGLTIFDPFR